eukprot:1148956-Pelagomonas_calceolata.AAC.2
MQSSAHQPLHRFGHSLGNALHCLSFICILSSSLPPFKPPYLQAHGTAHSVSSFVHAVLPFVSA